MRVPRRSPLAAALALLALGAGCAAPRALYDGPPLPADQTALLRGMPHFDRGSGPDGKPRPVAARGTVVVIGIDGRVFNEKVFAAYSGDAFLVKPGRHELLAYCEYSPNREGAPAVLYSDLFTLSFTARAGREYRFQAEFAPTWDERGRLAKFIGVRARPGVWDVTGDHSADASDRVSDDLPAVAVDHRTLTDVQAAVRRR